MTIQLEERSIGDLKVRVNLASMLIKDLYNSSDPRADGAIKELQRQQRKLNEVLVAKIAAAREVQPPPIVVGCEPVVLSGRAKGSPALRQGDAEDPDAFDAVNASWPSLKGPTSRMSALVLSTTPEEGDIVLEILY